MLIHEETGSGKTLAYLLPLMQNMDPKIPRQVGYVHFPYFLDASHRTISALPHIYN